MLRYIKRIAAHEGFMRYFSNTSYLMGGQLLRMGLALFVSIAVARHIGPADFGIYSLVLSIVAIALAIAKLGLDDLLKRELVAAPEKENQLLGTRFGLCAMAGGGLYLLILLIASQAGSDFRTVSLVALLGGLLLLDPFKAFELSFQARVRSDLSVKASSLALVFGAVAKLAAVYFDCRLVSFGYIYLIELVAVCLLQGICYRHHVGSVLDWTFSWSLAWQMMSKAWMLMLSSFAIIVYMRVDQVMLGVMIDDAAVGAYAAATRISMVWYFIPQALAVSLFPAIMNAKSCNENLYWRRLQRFLDLNTLIAYLVAIPLSILSPWIVLILFGSEFLEGGAILAVHAWSSIFVFMGVARGQYLTAEEFYGVSLVSTLLGLGINLMVNFVLIPKMGGVGAALGTIAAQFISTFLSSFLWSKTRRIGYAQLCSLLSPLRLRSIFFGS